MVVYFVACFLFFVSVFFPLFFEFTFKFCFAGQVARAEVGSRGTGRRMGSRMRMHDVKSTKINKKFKKKSGLSSYQVTATSSLKKIIIIRLWSLDEASGVLGERKDNYLKEEKVNRN